MTWRPPTSVLTSTAPSSAWSSAPTVEGGALSTPKLHAPPVALAVELAHVYRAELARDGVGSWACRLADEADRVPWRDRPVIQVFVDDYPDVYSTQERADLAADLRVHAQRLAGV